MSLLPQSYSILQTKAFSCLYIPPNPWGPFSLLHVLIFDLCSSGRNEEQTARAGCCASVELYYLS